MNDLDWALNPNLAPREVQYTTKAYGEVVDEALLFGLVSLLAFRRSTQGYK
jgi:hypothetical protein